MARAVIQPPSASAVGALNSLASPPARWMTASRPPRAADRRLPASPCSTNTSALPGATLRTAPSSASRASFERSSGAGSVTTATVPPPNIGAVATRSAIAAAVVSAPAARQRSGRIPVPCSSRPATAATARSMR